MVEAGARSGFHDWHSFFLPKTLLKKTRTLSRRAEHHRRDGGRHARAIPDDDPVLLPLVLVHRVGVAVLELEELGVGLAVQLVEAGLVGVGERRCEGQPRGGGVGNARPDALGSPIPGGQVPKPRNIVVYMLKLRKTLLV